MLPKTASPINTAQNVKLHSEKRGTPPDVLFGFLSACLSYNRQVGLNRLRSSRQCKGQCAVSQGMEHDVNTEI